LQTIKPIEKELNCDCNQCHCFYCMHIWCKYLLICATGKGHVWWRICQSRCSVQHFHCTGPKTHEGQAFDFIIIP